MQYVMDGMTPLGEVLMSADDEGLTGLWFVRQRHFAPFIDSDAIRRDLPIFDETRNWLEDYFSGNTPTHCPALHLMGTPFQRRVWSILCTIPYGRTMTYGRIAALVASQEGKDHMSAQAVGGAVGRNPVSIIVPCHRVVSSLGGLTGYAGGLWRKRRLLELEGAIVAQGAL